MVLELSEACAHRGRSKEHKCRGKGECVHASNKELLANLTREMAEPRVPESARTEACKQGRIVDSK